MKFDLLVFKGTDSIKFGMTSQEVQSILKITPTLFKKSEVDLFDTEDYKNTCHVTYEDDGSGILKSVAFEFFKNSEVYFNNVQLLGKQREEIEELFKNIFKDCTIDCGGISSPENELFLYAPVLPHEKIIQSVYIARKGYYEESKVFYEKAFSK